MVEKKLKRIIIAGTRTFDNYDLLNKTIIKYCKANLLHSNGIEIVCGGAKGADELGKQFAENHKTAIKIFPADWDTHGKAAGPIRNKQMALYSSVLIAFWDGKSKGTKNMIELAKEYKLETLIVQF